MPGFKSRVGKIVQNTVSDDTWNRIESRTNGLRPAPKTFRGDASSVSLRDLAEHFGTDKWSDHHRYTPHYERYLSHLRDSSFTFLEIGIGGYHHLGIGGGSLRMWKHYLPKAQIVGLDIEDKTFVAEDRIQPYVGSQVDPAILDEIFDDHPDIAVILDDGSHRPEHVIETFSLLFPRLPDGGIYIIEDTQTSYWPEWGGDRERRARGTTMDLVKDLVDGVNHEEFLVDDYQPTYTDLHVTGVHVFHNLVIIEKGDNVEGTNKVAANPETYGTGPVAP